MAGCPAVFMLKTPLEKDIIVPRCFMGYNLHMRDKTLQSLYWTWANMIQRCENPKRPDFKNWGGRGIVVCERWRIVKPRGLGFKNFVQDMGPRPFKMTIERKDNEKGYNPDNCVWATRKKQRANIRKTDSLQKAITEAAKVRRARTHCKRGHEFTPENTYLYRNQRLCKECRRAIDRFLFHGKVGSIDDYL
jgi:hypothetical protein